MKKNCQVLLLTFSLLQFTISAVLAVEIPAQALSAAQEFAETVDSGSFQAAYLSGSNLLLLAEDEWTWIDQVQTSQRLLGKPLERVLKASRTVQTYPGLPDGTYQLVYFETRTEKKQRAAEVILVEQQENGQWAVCKYSIR